MNIRLFSAIALGLALSAATFAQDAPPAPPSGQAPAQGPGPGGMPGQGQRGGRGGGAGMMGRGVTGTVTEVAASHYTIKNDSGEIYTVNFSANTRFMKQAAGMRQRGQGGQGGQGMGMGSGAAGNAAQALKPTDIKVGDAVSAMGEVNAAAKTVGATMIMQIDPERAKQMREMQANYGKTWLQGKVTAIDGVKVTMLGSVDNTAHSFVADENTTFRKRRDPVTLADIQVGDTVRADGAQKDGILLATTVSVMGAPPSGAPPAPGATPPPPPPQ
jgi:hypothetical protein